MGFEEVETEDAVAGTEVEAGEAFTRSANASDPAVALRKGAGAVTAMNGTVSTDGMNLTLAETLETSVILATASC